MNVKLLSTKVYWENAKERDEFKKFYDKYMKLLSEEAYQKKTGLSDKNPSKVSVELFTDKDKVDFIIPYGEVDSLMIHDSFNM